MLWVLAFHVIAVVAWFAGLFYLPRLFVYHAGNHSGEVNSLFNIMQHKLYYYIMWPAAVIASVLGYILLQHNVDFYRHQMWMHVKLVSAIFLWGYHISLGYMDRCFQQGRNKFSEKFFRIYNEVPTILLIVIVTMVVLKPVF
jgi:putative membrane protein